MSAIEYQILAGSIVCSTVCSCAGQRKHQSSTPLAFVRGSHRWLVDSPHNGPVTWKMFSFDDVILTTNSLYHRPGKFPQWTLWRSFLMFKFSSQKMLFIIVLILLSSLLNELSSRYNTTWYIFRIGDLMIQWYRDWMVSLVLIWIAFEGTVEGPGTWDALTLMWQTV